MIRYLLLPISKRAPEAVTTLLKFFDDTTITGFQSCSDVVLQALVRDTQTHIDTTFIHC